MEDLIRRLVWEFQNPNRQIRNEHAHEDWQHAIAYMLPEWQRTHATFDTIFDRLRALSREFNGIGYMTAWQDAIAIAQQLEMPYQDYYLHFIQERRREVAFVMADEHLMALIPFEGWELMQFFRFASNRLRNAIREMNRNRQDENDR